MKTINIAETLLRKRKEKGITQDALAHYIGVSKASVSKWETGTSYPDITFLPLLATYFDISIDELMSYNPQMTKEDIGAFRQRLTECLPERAIDETLDECRAIIKKYYSCYPLLMQMGSFMLNSLVLVTDPESRKVILAEIIDLFVRIREESGDVYLARTALKYEAYAQLGLENPDEALVLLEEFTQEPDMPAELLVFSAYQMKGEQTQAKRVLQSGLFQNLVVQFNYLINYLLLSVDDAEAFNETVVRAHAVAKTFDLPRLHPYLQLNLELLCAVGYALRGETESSLDSLERFVQLLAHSDAPLDLHGDSYFNLIDPWLDKLDTGTQLPAGAALAKEGLVEMATQHPAFAALAENQRYQNILAKLNHLKEN